MEKRFERKEDNTRNAYLNYLKKEKMQQKEQTIKISKRK